MTKTRLSQKHRKLLKPETAKPEQHRHLMQNRVKDKDSADFFLHRLGLQER